MAKGTDDDTDMRDARLLDQAEGRLADRRRSRWMARTGMPSSLRLMHRRAVIRGLSGCSESRLYSISNNQTRLPASVPS